MRSKPAQSTVGREDSPRQEGVPGQVRAWSGYERGEACEPVLRLEHHVGCAVPEGVGEIEHDPPGGIDREAFEGDRRPCDVSGEALELVALNGRARDCCPPE